MYSSVGKIQGSEQVVVLLIFYLCQNSLKDDLVEVSILLVIENTAIHEWLKTY